jgi:hypothetical protein
VCYFCEKEGHIKKECQAFQESVTLRQQYQGYKRNKFYSRRNYENTDSEEETKENSSTENPYIEKKEVNSSLIKNVVTSEDTNIQEEILIQDNQIEHLPLVMDLDNNKENLNLEEQKEVIFSNPVATPRDELAILGYTSGSSEKSKKNPDDLIPEMEVDKEENSVSTRKKNKPKKGKNVQDKDQLRSSPYKKQRSEGHSTQT